MNSEPPENPKIEVINPMYAGATPEDVGRAMMRQVDADRQENDRPERIKQDVVQSSI